MSKNPKALTSQEIHDYFEGFKSNVDVIKSCEEKIYTLKAHDEWIANYIHRSEAIRKAYRDNSAAHEELEPYLSGKHPFPDDMAEALFTELMNLDVGSYDDPFYAVPFCEALISHYRRKNSLNHLMLLYNRLGWEAAAAFRIGCKEYGKLSYDSYLKIISHKDEYALFDNFKVRRAIFVAYINITCVMPDFGIISIDKAFEFYEEAMELYHSKFVQDKDGDNDIIKELIDYMRERILSYEYMIPDAEDITKDCFCVLAREVYAEQCEKMGGEYEINVEPLIANYRALSIENRCSHSEAVEYLLAYYQIRSHNKNKPTRNIDFGADEEYYFQTQLPQSLIFYWLKDSRISKELRERETKRLIGNVNDFFKKISHTSYTSFMNREITTWCFKTLNLLDTFEEKENTIFNIILNRQIQTFFHSYMVAELAKAFTDAVLEKNPELFAQSCLVKTKEEVLSKREEIYRFVERASLYHDIGKNRMTDVINMQYRKLTDKEFELIRKHPAIGADSVDEDFDAYYNLILGHHKYFNGVDGYPERFNTVGIKDKFILDILSICDTLDASTDYYGRNYSRKKLFKDALKELKEGAGDRYSPVLVEVLETDTNLAQKIENLLTSGREEEYYNLVREHLQ